MSSYLHNVHLLTLVYLHNGQPCYVNIRQWEDNVSWCLFKHIPQPRQGPQWGEDILPQLETKPVRCGGMSQPALCENNATRLPFSGTPGLRAASMCWLSPIVYVQGLYRLNPASHCTATPITWTIRAISGMNEAGCSWAPIDNNVRWLGLVKGRTQRSQALMPHARKRSLVGAQGIWSG